MSRGALFIALAICGCDVSPPIRQLPDSGCPAIAPERRVWVDTSCYFDRCEATLRQSACTFQLNIEECVNGLEIKGRVAPDGKKTFDPSLLGACEEATTRSGALASLRCFPPDVACSIDVYERTELQATVDIITVIDEPFHGASGSFDQPLDTDDPLEGYFSSMALLENRAVVASYDGDFSELDCHDGATSRIHFYDLQTASPLGDMPVPFCLTLIAPDPVRGGFIGLLGAGSSTIAHFDNSGTLTSSAPIYRRFEGEVTMGVHLSISDDTVFALITSRGAAILFELDRQTFALRKSSPVVQGFMRGGLDFDASSFVIGHFRAGGVLGVDRATLEPRILLPLIEQRRLSDDVGFLAKTSAGSIYASTTGLQGASWIVDRPFSGGSERIGAAVYYEHVAIPWAATVSPQDPSKMLVGLMKPQSLSYEALVSRLDPAERRFLPGSVVIGQGVVNQMIGDRFGRVWASMPWSGKIARISFR